MLTDRGFVRGVKRIASGALLLAPTVAAADFFWPPALYYYGATVWWAVPVGLAAEYIILYPFLHLSPGQVLKVVIFANAMSALLGFLFTWPVVFWERGVEAVVGGATFSIALIALLILVVDIAIEYEVSVRWLGVSRSRRVLGAFVAANVASFVILVAAGISILRL